MLFIVFSNTAINYEELVATYAESVNYWIGRYEKDTVSVKGDEEMKTLLTRKIRNMRCFLKSIVRDS